MFERLKHFKVGGIVIVNKVEIIKLNKVKNI